MQVRYVTHCGGRLLQVFEQLDITTRGQTRGQADGAVFVDGPHWWVVDEQRVADDVAQAMLAKYERDGLAPNVRGTSS